MTDTKFVRDFLDVSTAHISPAAKVWLEGVQGNHAVANFEYGWFWVVPQSDTELLHKDLEPIAEYASKAGCHHILFDRDADTIDALPTHDW